MIAPWARLLARFDGGIRRADGTPGRPVVVVTGGSAGVGRATVRAFAEQGCDVAVLARGQEGLDAAVREVEERGGRGLGIPVDVAEPDAVEAAAERVERELGAIDVWVNDAMVSVFAPFWEISAEEFHRVTEVTYLGAVYGTMAALRRMRPRDHGVIVQVGSALAYRSIPLQSAYCGAKHGIVGFTDSIRSELIHDGSNVRITAVHLPALNTPQFEWVRNKLPRHAQPVPPIFQPEVAADAIVWAAGHHRREVLLARSTWQAVLGQRIVPGFVDAYLGRTGWQSQMTEDPRPERPDNLFEPVAGDHGARGPFVDRSRSSAPSFFFDRHRRVLLAALGSVSVLLARASLRRG